MEIIYVVLLLVIIYLLVTNKNFYNDLTINQLNLKLRHTSVYRIVNLAGSDDLTNWYATRMVNLGCYNICNKPAHLSYL